MNNPNIHIVSRFILWIDSKTKEQSDWTIENNVICKLFKDFRDYSRYQTVDLVEILTDILHKPRYLVSDYQGDEKIFFTKKMEKEDIKVFDILPDYIKERYKEVIENAIKLNVEEFKIDW